MTVMDFLRAHQLNFMLAMTGADVIITILVIFTSSMPKKRRVALFLMELGAAILLTADRFAYLYRGNLSLMGYYMVRVCNFSVFFFSLFLLFAYDLYLIDISKSEFGLKKVPHRLLISLVLVYVGIVLLILSQFTGFYYTFDSENRYQRGMGFLVCYAMPFPIMILQASVVINYRKRLSPSVFFSMILFTVFPIIATIFQFFAYGLSLTNMSLVFAAVLLYIFVIFDMNKKIENASKREIELLKKDKEHMNIMFSQTAEALASAIDAKDKYTHGHSTRVAEIAKQIAIAAGKGEKECREIYFAALLHDVGKIGIPDSIINKTEKLTDEEYAIIKSHTTIGSKILLNISQSPYISLGAHYHHERYDGTGYPEKLRGEEIPEIARIIAVADTYDAMTSKRSYRNPLPKDIVIAEIERGMGNQFDPTYATIMLQLIK
ncbi:MAG: HD-GYP domain-containing protein [Spirochaetaceae bacterium]|nr:HD-GYP domain-containing protein [Spirochaetaceae bacterium]